MFPLIGEKMHRLLAVSDDPWRSNADTRERLELLAQQLVLDYLLDDERDLASR